MSEGFQIVARATVTDSKLTSNVPETVAAWNSVTAYTSGTDVSHKHYIWQASENSTNKEPGSTAGASFWTQIKPTNRWAMFDDYIHTPTVNPEVIEFEITEPRRFDTVALFGVEAASVNLKVLNGGVELENRHYDMVDYTGVVGYWSLYFEEHGRRSTVLAQGLPILSGLTIKVRAEMEGGNVKIGAFDYGRADEIGATLLGPTLGFISLSKFDPDEQGYREIVKRPALKQGDFDVAVPNEKYDSVYKKLLAYDGVMALVIGSNLYESMIYRGLMRGAKLTLPFHEKPVLRVSIEDS